MIDEQHPIQMGVFPMDIKCNTILQQQKLQQQTSSLLKGNDRMLTTLTSSTTTGKGAETASTVVNGLTTYTTTTTNEIAVTTAVGNGNCSTITTKIPTVEITTQNKALLSNKTTALSLNVNGTCNNRNNNNNNSSTNNNNYMSSNSNNSNNYNTTSNYNSKTTNCMNNQQSSNHCGSVPGPGPPHSLVNMYATNSLTSGRVTLGECSVNGIGGNASGCGVDSVGLCDTSVLGGSSTPFAIQEHIQQHLQLHGPHPNTILQTAGINNHFHHHHHHHQSLPPGHPQHHHHHLQQPLLRHHHPTIASNISASTINVNDSLSSLSLISSSTCNGDASNVSGLSLRQCGYCCQTICDRFIMRVVDTSFHEGCLKCATCSLHLVHSCFARDGKLYCRIDYERLFIRNRCLGCGHKIASDELVMRTLENVFHLKCFACVVCGALLKKGEQYVVKQGQLFCRFDYEKEVEMLQGYDFYGDDLFPPKMDGRRGPKRPRTILNTQQRRAFKASFELSPKPCRKVRENLAKETGLSLRIVQVWFQNQRAKVKKIQKKAKQEHVKGNSDSQESQESDSSLAKVKDEAQSDSESLLESPFSSCGAGGNSSSDGLVKLRTIKEENENAPFNCMETNKENFNKTNEPILNTILGLSYATFQQLMGPFSQTSMINPIDRLYSMQNSYFRPDEVGYGECGKEISDNKNLNEYTN